MIMKMVFKIEAMLGCAISFVKSVDGMLPILLDLMLLEIVILALLTCMLTMIIGSCQVILFVLQPELEPLREVEHALKTNVIKLFLK